MNYGTFEEGQNTECLWVNTLPNNTILVQYNEAEEVCKIVNKLKELDISFSRDKYSDFIPKYLFGVEGYKEFNQIRNGYLPGPEGCDYSPVAYMFTNRGEYGYSQLTVYMSDMGRGTVLIYEHQYKGAVLIHYFIEK